MNEEVFEDLIADMDSVNLNNKSSSKSEQNSNLVDITKIKIEQTTTTQITPKTSTKTPTQKGNKRIDIIEEYNKRNAEKESLNLVIIGHVDAGKSTLMGHLLYLLGEVNDKTMKKYERESSKIGKSSFAYAWVLDETEEERNRGITIDIAMTKFETKNKRFTLLDAPGHRDFIPNMISGAAQADAAILVIDATVGEFEAGFDANGQTKEHALLARSLGVQQLVVAINKLDNVEWSKDRFDIIVSKLSQFLLSQVGFKKKGVFYIPCSGLTGDNLLKKTDKLLDWYSGPTLIEQIDKFEPPVRLIEKPFRLSITDFFKGGSGSLSGITVAGRIETGSLQIGDELIIIPGKGHATVKAIQVLNESFKWAVAVGSILCPISNPVPLSSQLLVRIVVFEVKIPITRGYNVILHRQSLNEPAIITRLKSIIDKTTGEQIKKNPRHIPKSTAAIVEIQLPNRPIPIETFKDNKELGRIMIRKGVIAPKIKEAHKSLCADTIDQTVGKEELQSYKPVAFSLEQNWILATVIGYKPEVKLRITLSKKSCYLLEFEDDGHAHRCVESQYILDIPKAIRSVPYIHY
ncbi:2930_t:CDS:10 [Entrophospora sp. SA101]|nr:2930_t:CDS:10 [Entrophospora sp. SA101]